METNLPFPDAGKFPMSRRLSHAMGCILAFTAMAPGLAGSRAHATGDYYEQPLQTLPDYLRLDQLPAKSFEQIDDETRKPSAEGADIDSWPN
jgi:hypothetical protein